MSVDTFIDTNVFIYHLDASDARKHILAEVIVRDALASGRAGISFQVVQECLNTALRKAEVGLSAEEAHDYLKVVLTPLVRVSHATPELYARALDVRQRWQLQFYDALIVAAALQAGCKRLLSEDMQHGQRIEQLVIENPFLG